MIELEKQIQQFALDCLAAAACHAVSCDPFGAPKGPLYSVTIPGAKRLIPIILDFARTGTLRFDINGFPVKEASIQGQPLADSEGLTFMLSPHGTQFIRYVNPTMRSLCSGEWTTLAGRKQIRFDKWSLWPNFSYVGEAAVISWSALPRLRWNRWLVRSFELGIKSIKITRDEGRIDVTAGDWLLPDLEWGD